MSPTGGVVGLQGQPRAGGRDREGRRHEEAEIQRPGAVLRLRGGCLRGRCEQRGDYQAGEVIVIRYEGPQGRARHARDAGDHGGDLRPGHGRQGGVDHRRALLRRVPAASASAMSARRRRSAARSAYCWTATSSPSTPKRGRWRWRCPTPSWRSAARAGPRAATTSSPAPCGNTPSSRRRGEVTHKSGLDGPVSGHRRELSQARAMHIAMMGSGGVGGYFGGRMTAGRLRCHFHRARPAPRGHPQARAADQKPRHGRCVHSSRQGD